MKAGTGPRLRVLILAAGRSARLGAPKALARIRGASLLRRTLACVAGLSPDPVLIVVARPSAALRREVRGFRTRFLVNRRAAEGLAQSVRRGLRGARHASAILILPVDLAHLARGELQRLVSRWRGAPRRVAARRVAARRVDARRVDARVGDARGGVPVILPARRFIAAARLTGDVGLREYLISLPPAERVLVDLPSAALDVDTPQDLRRARRIHAGGVCTKR